MPVKKEKTEVVDLRAKRIEATLADIADALRTGDVDGLIASSPFDIAVRNFDKNPEKYGPFLVAHYRDLMKLGADSTVMRKAADFVLSNADRMDSEWVDRATLLKAKLRELKAVPMKTKEPGNPAPTDG